MIKAWTDRRVTLITLIHDMGWFKRVVACGEDELEKGKFYYENVIDIQLGLVSVEL